MMEALREKVRQELQAVEEAALASHHAATHEESRSEDKHDTRSIEAGYLAGAQAQRVALLIGNANYSVGRLTNPPQDVRAMQGALDKLGFKVQVVLNANQNQMKRAVRDFGSAAQGAEILGGTPAEYAAHLRTEMPRWAKAVKDSGAKAE
jgi:hypothetical protein